MVATCLSADSRSCAKRPPSPFKLVYFGDGLQQFLSDL